MEAGTKFSHVSDKNLILFPDELHHLMYAWYLIRTRSVLTHQIGIKYENKNSMKTSMKNKKYESKTKKYENKKVWKTKKYENKNRAIHSVWNAPALSVLVDDILDDMMP